MEIKVVKHYSEEYWNLVRLRDKVLREPLNLMFSEEELFLENKEIHIGVFEGNKVIGCLVLKQTDEDTTLKMRQVCIAPTHQRTGIGKYLIKYTENYCAQNKINKIICNAREKAIPFYETLGYKKKGEPFYEVKILHYYMEKNL